MLRCLFSSANRLLVQSLPIVEPLLGSKNIFGTAACITRLQVTRLQSSTSQPSTDASTRSLMQFFDDSSNWLKEKVTVGRPWQVAELRLKSNEDLHKLWYVLLKERNMLLTMEAEYKRKLEHFPSPDRIYKVEESMENVLEVVEERDRAFHLLEHGVTGERGGAWRYNILGLRQWRRRSEHPLPFWLNTSYQRRTCPHGPWIERYLTLWREKHLRRVHARHIYRARLRRQLRYLYPHLTPEVLKNVRPQIYW